MATETQQQKTSAGETALAGRRRILLAAEAELQAAQRACGDRGRQRDQHAGPAGARRHQPDQGRRPRHDRGDDRPPRREAVGPDERDHARSGVPEHRERLARACTTSSNNSETDATLKLRVMNVSKNELYRDLRNYPDAKWDQSPLFKKIYEAEFGQLGGEPFGCLVGDYHFDQSAMDVRLLRDLGKVAAAAHCPFISGAAPTLLGMDSWTELSNPRDLSKIFETPDYAGWKSLRDSENSRYVGAVHAARAGARALRRQVRFRSRNSPSRRRPTATRASKYAWMNAAYAMAANINRAYKEYGWTVRIRGVQSGGEVINLPTHTFPTDDGDVDLKCPTEIAISDRREAELSKSGPAAAHPSQELGQGRLHRRAVALPAEEVRQCRCDRVGQHILAHPLHVRRLALQPLPQMHGARPDRRDQGEGRICRSGCRSGSSSMSTATRAIPARRPRRKKPLADAKVEVFADEENPGYYSARFFLRPALPARRHGHRHEPRLTATRPAEQVVCTM